MTGALKDVDMTDDNNKGDEQEGDYEVDNEWEICWHSSAVVAEVFGDVPWWPFAIFELL